MPGDLNVSDIVFASDAAVSALLERELFETTSTGRELVLGLLLDTLAL